MHSMHAPYGHMSMDPYLRRQICWGKKAKRNTSEWVFVDDERLAPKYVHTLNSVIRLDRGDAYLEKGRLVAEQ